MDISRHPAPLRFCVALAGLLVVAMAGGVRADGADADGVACEMRIRGDSIVRLTLVEKTGRSGVRFDKPGETVQLPAGEYRVEQVELKDSYVLDSQPSQRKDWFKVTPAGPNELIVGAPLYPTASARRHGGFIQLSYDTVDGAGRSYSKTIDRTVERPPPPTFTVFKNGEKIGSGSFEYG